MPVTVMNKVRKPQATKTPSPAHYRPVPHYFTFCGWCGKETQRVTDGRMIVCGKFGH
jgi:NADH pyrophosphatase NudC (nudix superfamily)